MPGRRSVLKLFTALPLLASPHIGRARASATDVRFLHGVASGDPEETSVLLWTRITSTDLSQEVEFSWRIATDERFDHVVGKGTGVTGPGRDFTAKIVARGLIPGRTYHYQFRCGDVVSPAGRTRTLPRGRVAALRFAVVSCSNYPAGLFNVYGDIADQDDMDAVIHLGDYIYEYGVGGYASENAEALGRLSEPPHKLATLGDYRVRHAQYKTDPDLQRLHARHPMIAVWDDHEFLNNSWSGGSEGFVGGEAEWRRQRAGAIRAYREWMPIRDGEDQAPDRIFRSFRYGDLLSLIMLDTRHFGRDEQLSYQPDPARADKARHDPGRSMMGQAQERWLETTLKASRGQSWQFIGQQTLVGELLMPERLGEIVIPGAPSRLPKAALDRFIALARQRLPFVLDTWDGYAGARSRLLDMLRKWATNPIVLTGDVHTAMAGKLRLESGGRVEAIELVTPSVTSPGLDGYFPSREGALGKAVLAANPDLLFFEGTRHGWIDLGVTHETCSAAWRFVDTIMSRAFAAHVGFHLAIKPKDGRDGFQTIRSTVSSDLTT